MNDPSAAPRVFAVVPVYRGTVDQAAANLSVVGSTVSGVVIVDNSGDRDPGRWKTLTGGGRGAHIIMNGRNAGVAAALNQGVAAARAAGAEFVLLLDDDSRPAPGMVAALLEGWRARQQAGDRVAAVGPDYADDTGGGRAIFVRWRGGRPQRTDCACGQALIPTDGLMTSGSLIPLAAWDAVGPFRDGLFVDYVDIEWCFRARSLGFSCFGVCAARMDHRFGDGALPWLRVAGRRVPRRAPVRFYFMFRNGLLLLRLSHVPAAWKAYEALRLPAVCAAHMLLAPRRLACFCSAGRGLLDGMLGREGPAPAALA